ncbi:Alkyl transferase [Aphelenchoides fujianensis]|nr:Alkyl transferase [Aphelenchoides fujianensis]
MSLVGANRLPLFGNVAVRLLNLHPIPKHVGLIMLDNVVDGHAKGFDQLIRVVEWSIHLGVREVTVYAFSLENFKRSEQEVQALQKLAEELLKSRQLENIGVRVRFFGNKSKFPDDVRKTMDDVEESTKKHCRGIVNICVAYTAQDEIVRVMQRVQADVQRGDLKPSAIDEACIEKPLDTRDSLPLDMMIRTSGEQQLSDFLLWQVGSPRRFAHSSRSLQCGNAFVYFDNVLWPDFGFWHFFKAVFQYQLHMMKIREPVAVA